MAQILTLENDTQSTVNFSTAEPGDFFIYSNDVYIVLDNNNPNASKISDGSIIKMNDTDQIILPGIALLKLE